MCDKTPKYLNTRSLPSRNGHLAVKRRYRLSAISVNWPLMAHGIEDSDSSDRRKGDCPDKRLPLAPGTGAYFLPSASCMARIILASCWAWCSRMARCSSSWWLLLSGG
ncbi:hypothetical protein M5D96_007583 [Drosophila gunungcola]|uniref:Uncharacterized protein n=1 Tax=Drosophila gunungcola TaxID=103775 RepID=A0A9P9YNU0_9MUSC|nr:hypothetical protein M5D96_007583 [Drosophila gunungcola]